jgi:hypothetical protein
LGVVVCSQCGREAPRDSDEVSRWRHGELALGGDLDEVTAGLLLCPACLAEDREGAFEAGGED